ncbi:MAG: hypothetical protein JWQ28_885 [Pedobacter sp.]|jgi:hypothetical protein|nr:hypothetical protein [Pedobacter sp.]
MLKVITKNHKFLFCIQVFMQNAMKLRQKMPD